jgi:hypothetical protein
VRDRTPLKLKGRVRRIVRIRTKSVAVFVDAFWDVRCAEARDSLHFAEQVVQDVPPVCKHVKYDSAALCLAVVP